MERFSDRHGGRAMVLALGAAALLGLALPACGDDDGGDVREIDGSDSGSESGSDTGSSSGSS